MTCNIPKNFEITAKIDGRKREVTFSPQAWDGGFTLQISMRNGGKSWPVLLIVGSVRDGCVHLKAFGSKDELVYRQTTAR